MYTYVQKNPLYIHVDGILSLNRSKFGDIVDSVYPIKFGIKDTTDAIMSTSYFDLWLVSVV